MRYVVLTWLLFVTCAVQAEVQPAEHYAVIYQRSIFSRGRTPAPMAKTSEPTATVEPDAPPPPPAPIDPASLYRLVGVSLVGDRHVAFFEDTRDGSVHPAAVDDMLFDRRIVSVSLDSITTTTGDNNTQQTIAIGQSLSGAQLESTPRVPVAKPADSDAGLSIIERLRRKREQELSP